MTPEQRRERRNLMAAMLEDAVTVASSMYQNGSAPHTAAVTAMIQAAAEKEAAEQIDDAITRFSNSLDVTVRRMFSAEVRGHY